MLEVILVKISPILFLNASFNYSLMISTSLEGIKAGAVEHLLLNLAAVRAPGHEENLGLESSLGPVRVELVVVVVDTISAVICISILLVQVIQKVLVTVIPVAHLWRNQP